MENIPIKTIASEPNPFRIRNLQDILQGKDLWEKTHRHDFFFCLVLERGEGQHLIDFAEHSLQPYCVFLLRPGQVHSLCLRSNASGYILNFGADYGQGESGG
ncbi:MAG: AraC family ligand binding domain-containing protein [Bacteroidota bacterium]